MCKPCDERTQGFRQIYTQSKGELDIKIITMLPVHGGERVVASTPVKVSNFLIPLACLFLRSCFLCPRIL